MSALDFMRKEMESLMGGAVDGDSPNFWDREVCKNFLVGLCTNGMFDNTRFQTTECGKLHSQVLKSDYEKAKEEGKYYSFERDHLYFLERLIDEAEKFKIHQQRRVDAEEREKNAPPSGPEAEEISNLAAKIGEKLSQAESLGEEGEIDKSMEMMSEVETLKTRKAALEKTLKSKNGNTSSQKLRVCEVCGSYLNIFDNDRRLADHFIGKLHTGRLELQNRYQKYKEKIESEAEDRSKKGEQDRSSSRSSSDRGHRDRDSRRDYDYDRSYHDRDRGYRDGDRDRHHGRRGSRDKYIDDRRDRDRRSSDRDRYNSSSRRDNDRDYRRR